MSTFSTPMTPNASNRVFIFLSTGFGLSTLPSYLTARLAPAKAHQTFQQRKVTGAGLVGSIEGALTYLLLPSSVATSLWAPVVGIALSVWVSGRAETALQTHDDPRIVIDEWVGAWLAVWGLEQRIDWTFVAAFVLFRVFDVVKGPIGKQLQRLPGGWGITADDIYAGIAANIVWRVGLLLQSRF